MRTSDIEQLNELEVIAGLGRMIDNFKRGQEFRAWFMDPYEQWKSRAFPNVPVESSAAITKWIEAGGPGAKPEPAASIGRGNVDGYLKAMTQIIGSARLGPYASSAVEKLQGLATNPEGTDNVLTKQEYLAVWETMYTIFANQKMLANQEQGKDITDGVPGAEAETTPATEPATEPRAEPETAPAPASSGDGAVFTDPERLRAAWEAYKDAGGTFNPRLRGVLKDIWMNAGGVRAESKKNNKKPV